MDDFNPKNNLDETFDVEHNDESGEITGFDDFDNQNGSDGFYTKTHADIIQDNLEEDSPFSGSSVDNNSNSSNNYNDFGYGSNSGSGSYNNSFGYNSNNNYYASPIVNTKPKKEKKKYGAGIVLLASVLAAIIGVSGSVLVFNYKNKGVFVDPDGLPKIPSIISNDEENETSSENEQITSSETSTANTTVTNNVSSIAQAVASKCSKSVVGIRTTTSVVSFFGGTSEATGEGSGVVYTSDGYIITNYHVIENAVTSSNSSKIEVFFNNANTNGYQASVIGYNISADLAVLKVNASKLSKVEVGNSDSLNVGQYAVIIGAPGGLEFMGSVTYGIISGLNRIVSSDSQIGLIQTDAAINPGNSGGALLDENGKLIGINSSKIVSEEFEGMGFAIPINTVVEICNGIITNKDKKEPYVGITISDKYTSDVLSAYGYPVGAVVLSVADGSTAESCGIQKGDIITEFNGKEITEYNVFSEVLAKCTPNSTVDIKIYRSGRYYQTKITIGSNS